MKLDRKKQWNTLEATDIGKNFLSRTQVVLLVKQLRERIDKWDDMKLNSICITKEMVSKLKWPPTEWKKIFASCTLDKRLIMRIYRELKKLN
jgi:hypothetical protein